MSADPPNDREVRAGGAGSLPLPEPEELHAYFQQVEKHFVGLRGAPFLLTPQDWKTISEWHEAGIPLSIIRSSLDEVFRRRAERGDGGRISSIRYCAGAVEAAWREAQELLLAPWQRGERKRSEGLLGSVASGGSESAETSHGGVPWRQRIADLAAALPGGLPDGELWRQRLLALGASPSEAAAREGLVELESALLGDLLDALTGDLRDRLELKAEQASARLRGRVEQGQVAAARQSLMQRLVREHYALPVLRIL